MVVRTVAAWCLDPYAIPLMGMPVLLNSVANMEAGGENLDATDQLHPGCAEISRRVRRARFNPIHVGFDLI